MQRRRFSPLFNPETAKDDASPPPPPKETCPSTPDISIQNDGSSPNSRPSTPRHPSKDNVCPPPRLFLTPITNWSIIRWSSGDGALPGPLIRHPSLQLA